MAKKCPKCEEGLPEWLATFADLMSLLLCFFVLLLSFATIDAIKFKKLAESMKDAFGVQREVVLTDIVMGTSVIKQEFSPSVIPEPSLIDEIRQQTTQVEQEKLGMPNEQEELEVEQSGGQDTLDVEQAKQAIKEQQIEEVQQQADKLKESLTEVIDSGLVSIETDELKIIIRIQEKGSFPSGGADLNREFLDVMDTISEAVAEAPGNVLVAGHTDDVPISTRRFRSNWELSSARAVSVVHALLNNPNVDPSRVTTEGHADTRPLVPNDSAENRAVNRRVELVIERNDDKEDEPFSSADPGDTLNR